MKHKAHADILPVRPTHDFLFIDIVDRDVTKKDLGGGKFFHLLSDDTFGPARPHNPVVGQHPGVRPRWARVLMIGPEAKGDVNIGDMVLCDTLKWSHGIPLGKDGVKPVLFWRINVNDVLLRSDKGSAEYLDQMRTYLSEIDIAIGRR